MPRIKADIPTFSGSLNVEDFLDWVSETEKYFELVDIPEDFQVKSSASTKATDSHMAQDEEIARFNNGLRYDIQSIVSLQLTWTIDEAVRIALKAKQSKSRELVALCTKLKLLQTKAVVANQEAITKSSNNLYARPVGIKCYRCQEVGHASNQCRATKRVNLAEGDKTHSEYEDEGLIISPNAIFKDDDDHSQAFLGLVRRLVLTSTKKSQDSQRHNIFKHGARSTKMCSTLSLTEEVVRILSHETS
ncbi:RNA-directed DNA polymerase [Tanacetum coccineum]